MSLEDAKNSGFIQDDGYFNLVPVAGMTSWEEAMYFQHMISDKGRNRQKYGFAVVSHVTNIGTGQGKRR